MEEIIQEKFTNTELYNSLKSLIVHLNHPDLLISTDYVDTLRIYLYEYPDSDYTKSILTFFSKVCAPYYDVDNIIKALNLPDENHYYKKQEIFKTFPFALKDRHILSAIGNIMLAYKDCYYTLDGPNSVISDYVDDRLSKDICEQLISFRLNNDYLFRSNKEIYEGLEIDHDRFTRMLTYNTYSWKDFEKYKQVYKFYNRYNNPSKKEYFNYLLGRIGEYVIWEQSMNNKNASFIASEINDGFGYDVYYEDGGKDKLLEVKSTMDVNGRDNIILSPHEYRTIMTAKEKNADYIIARVYIPESNPYSYYSSYLHYDDEKDILFDPDKDIEYTRVRNRYKRLYCNLSHEPLNKRKGFTLNNM